MVHCVKVSGTTIILVDEDAKCMSRINAERARIEDELGMKIIVLSSSVKAEISSRSVERPDDSYRDGVTGESPAALLYTR